MSLYEDVHNYYEIKSIYFLFTNIIGRGHQGWVKQCLEGSWYKRLLATIGIGTEDK